MFEPEQNAIKRSCQFWIDYIKNSAFLKHCLYQPNLNNDVFKGKVFEQNETL